MRILQAVRSLGIEEMWEDHKDESLSGIKSLARSLGAECEVKYPTGTYKGRCDLVVPASDGRTWVECKFAWTYNVDRRPAEPNANYRKHLLSNSQASAAKDVSVKLASLIGQPKVAKVGFLLVAFHSIQLPLPDEDIAELERLTGLDREPWSRHTQDDWTSPRNADCRIRAYYWERPGVAADGAREPG